MPSQETEPQGPESDQPALEEQASDLLTTLGIGLHGFMTMIRSVLTPEVMRGIGFAVLLAQKAPDLTRAHLKALAKAGWHPDPFMPFHMAFNLDEDRPFIEVEQEFEEWYRENLKDIEERLCRRYPGRARVLASAFRNHREKEFSASVLIFLTQADGIAKEKIPGFPVAHLYSGKRELIARRRELIDRSGLPPLSKALLEDLRERLPLGERGGAGGLDRNAILHGEDSDYGTEVNSLKAISLLSYLDWMIPRLRKAARRQSGPEIQQEGGYT